MGVMGTVVEMSADELKAYEEAPKVMFCDLYGHIYKEPSMDSPQYVTWWEGTCSG